MIAAFLGAVLQRAVGAGYSVVLLPAAVVALPDDRATSCVQAVGVLLCGGLLLRDGAPESVGRLRNVLLAAVAGQVAALAIVGPLDAHALRIAAAVLLLLACVLALGRQGRDIPAAVGAVVGAISALVGITGPFLALLVVATRDGEDSMELRRRLWLGVAALSATALLIAGLLGSASGPGTLSALALVPALWAGTVVGARAAATLAPRWYPTVVVAVAASGAAVLLAGV